MLLSPQPNTQPNTQLVGRVALIRHEEQSRFERHMYPGAIGIWLTSLLMAGAVHFVAPELLPRATAWVAAFTLVMLVSVLGWALYGRHLASMDERDRFHSLAVLLNAASWMVAPVILYAPHSVQPEQQSLVTLFMVCMVAGCSAAAVPIFGTRPRLYVMMFVPIFLGQIVVFGWHGLRYSDGFHGLMALAMLLLLTVNLMFSRFSWATFRQSIELAYDNEELVGQLKAQTQELSEQTRVAQEANTAKTKFLAAASHDLRQPVHALNLFVEVLSGTELTDKQKNMVQHIRAASQASSEMLNVLLDYSRIEAGVMVAKPTSVALAPLLRTLEDEFGPQADSKQLVYRTRDTDALAWCDPVMTPLVLRNFVSNALRYTSSGGVLVCARKRGAEVMVQVMDTGVGIAREHWDEIFKEFRQLGNEERDRQKGLGLGLAIAKGLAQSMGARIEINSRLGHGSVFTLCLPAVKVRAVGVAEPRVRQEPPWKPMDSGAWAQRAQPAAVSAAVVERATVAATAVATAAQKAADSLDQRRVLVVDDEEPVRQSMQALLESWGCEVRVAEGLQEAQALLGQGFVPQMLLTDYRLREGQTGGQVISALRQDLPGLQAVIITGDTAPERIREAASHDAVLLHKPVPANTLRQGMLELMSH
jgi:two-component system, sensor histidine kinase